MIINSLKLSAIALVLLATAGVARAADCQLRALQYVGIHTDGRLIINAEMWDAGTNTKVGLLANSPFCKVSASYNGIAPQTCQAWQATATSAMLAGKKLYVNAPTCTAGNGITVAGVTMIGLNN